MAARTGFFAGRAAVSTAVAALAVVAVVLSAAGCGEQTDAAGAATSPRDAAVASYQRWAGDLAAHQAAEVVVAHRLNGPWAACMQGRGYDASWQAAIAAPREVDPLAASLWLTEPEAPPYSAGLLLSAWSDRQRDRLSTPSPRMSGPRPCSAATCPTRPATTRSTRSASHPP